MDYWQSMKDSNDVRASFQFRNIVSMDVGKEIVEVRRPLRPGFT